MQNVTTAHAIDWLFADRRAGSTLSLADAVRQIRPLVPGCELTDDELADLVSWHAVRSQVNLHFDRTTATD